MSTQYYPSSYSENVEARFGPYTYTRTIRNKKGVLEKVTRNAIGCWARVRGDRDAEDFFIVRESNERELRDKFPKAWAAHKGEQVPEDLGIPIEELFSENPQIAAGLREFGITTIDYFARAPENVASKLGQGWRRKQAEAKEYIQKRYAPKMVALDDRVHSLTPEQKAVYDKLNGELVDKIKTAYPQGQEAMPAIGPDPDPDSEDAADDGEEKTPADHSIAFEGGKPTSHVRPAGEDPIEQPARRRPGRPKKTA